MTVIAILADHLEVPSKTDCRAAFMCPECARSSTPKTDLINSKISGFSFSLSFIRSLIAVTIELALSSAPCLLDFSAAL